MKFKLDENLRETPLRELRAMGVVSTTRGVASREQR